MSTTSSAERAEAAAGRSGRRTRVADPRRRWLILGLGTSAQLVTSIFQFGLPFLLPEFQQVAHGSLAQAGVLVASPSVGMMLALIPWGALADRRGDRLVMTCGLTGSAGCLAASALVTGPAALFLLLMLAGASAAAVSSASGRVILTWFPAHERGRAMGVRQAAQPLGIAAAAVLLPAGVRWLGFPRLFLIPALLAIVVAALVATFVVEPTSHASEQKGRAGSPYAVTSLWRIHAASGLLVVPQFTISAFAYLFMIERLEWSPAGAGALLAGGQLCGAVGRFGAGHWSDRVDSRLGPMRSLSIANATVLTLLAAAALHRATAAAAVIAVVAAGVVTVSGNGLAFTAVAELAGPSWAGRALAIQNTTQYAVASVTPAVAGALIAARGYAFTFACTVAFALAAAPLIPATSRRRSGVVVRGDGSVDTARQDP